MYEYFSDFLRAVKRLCLILKLPTWEAQGDVSVVKKRPLYEDLYTAFSCQRALGPTKENAGN